MTSCIEASFYMIHTLLSVTRKHFFNSFSELLKNLEEMFFGTAYLVMSLACSISQTNTSVLSSVAIVLITVHIVYLYILSKLFNNSNWLVNTIFCWLVFENCFLLILVRRIKKYIFFFAYHVKFCTIPYPSFTAKYWKG